MSLLHDYFHTRDLRLFQGLLESSYSDNGLPVGPGSSGSKSGKKHSLLSTGNVDVNVRDWLGRTVLHLCSVSVEHLDYVRALLKHPTINVNLPDAESHWTPLHRALYNANIPTTRLLLQRSDIDVTLKDNEGYTAFDLYNSTLVGTKPSLEEGEAFAELYTWGANVNAALGFGDGNDRVYPEQVTLHHKEDVIDLHQQTLSTRFLPAMVRHVEMSKLHTAVITSESGGNLRVCGFGSGGRLGSNFHTQYDLKPLAQFSQTVTLIALGQDHTLALTKNGEVLSWGLNRFSQLGYLVELSPGSRTEEPIQFTPRKVQGPLKREIVEGVAASKCASACWTEDCVYTWGTNNGQLGYDKVAQPVQVLPRKVSRLTAPVIAISMTDNAMACLMQNRQVECFHNDGHHRISFPALAFPYPIRPYRPPQAVKESRMAKITSCGDVFASLSYHGEVHIFSPSSEFDPSGKGGAFKSQRVWALRKKFSAVKDVALGADGSIIICTESGHVFVRARNAKSGQGGKTFKFQRVPFLQRVTRVCANASGAFGALRVDFKPKPIEVKGNMIWQDITKIQSFLQVGKNEDPVSAWMENRNESRGIAETCATLRNRWDSDAEEAEDDAIENDIKILSGLCDAIRREEAFRKEGIKLGDSRLPHGADTIIQLPSGALFPAHAVILATRSDLLCKLLSAPTKSAIKDDQQNIKISLLPALRRNGSSSGSRSRELVQISFTGCQPLSVLILLNYLYSDNVVAIWDRRISAAGELYVRNSKRKINPPQIKADLQGLARMLELHQLLRALERPVKLAPSPTMVQDMTKLFNRVQSSEANLPQPIAPDVVLELEDKEVRVHSAILRCRSELFQSFFDEPDWTRKRWNEEGVVRINLRHLKWRVMEFVLKFMCCGMDAELFEKLEFVQSVDDVLEFMFEVMAAANELLLDRLVLLCSDVILTYSNIHNACYVLADATRYDAEQLIDRIQSYITANMELFLECHMLDDIPPELVLQLARFAMKKQQEKAPNVRKDKLVERAMQKHQEWLELQDIPVPFVRSNKPWPMKKNALPLPKFEKRAEGGTTKSLRRLTSADDIFIMDDAESLSPTYGLAVVSPPAVAGGLSAPVWKAYVSPKVDMKAVMAEAASQSPNYIYNASRLSENWGKQSKPQSVPSTPQATKGLSHSPGSLNTLDPPTTPQKSKEVGRSPISQIKSQGSNISVPPPTTPPGAAPGPVMGPTITPTRLPVSSARSVSGSGKAWINRSIEPIAPSVPAAESGKNKGKGVSFLAIQHSQQEEQLFIGPTKDKRSLVEIQEEEKEKRQEEEFLRWWEGEEARVKMEMDALAQFQADAEGPFSGSGSGKQRGRRGQRGQRGGGGERGGERRGGGGGRGGPKGRKEPRNAGDGAATQEGQAQPQANAVDPEGPRIEAGASSSNSALRGQTRPWTRKAGQKPRHVASPAV